MNDMWLYYFTRDSSFPFYIQYGEHNENVFLHTHADFSELVVVLNGTAEHIVDNEQFSLQKGDVFVMSEGSTHGYENVKDFRICNIMFRARDLLNVDYDIKELAGFHALFLLEPYFNNTQGFKSRLKLSPDSFNEVERFIKTIVTEYSENRGGRNTLLQSYFLQLVVMLSRLYGCPPKQRDFTGIAQAAAYIETHYMDEYPIKQAMEISHYSRRHFSRLFSAVYNLSPQQYLLETRLRHACRILKENNCSISETAQRSGFSDPNYFSRVFKKYLGVLPSKFNE